MRQKHNPQSSIFEYFPKHETGQQLKIISRLLDNNPAVIDLAFTCLQDDNKKDTGRKGLTVDSIVRAALLKQMMGLTYRELSFYLQDSFSYANFARIEGQEGLSPTRLQASIKRIYPNYLKMLTSELSQRLQNKAHLRRNVITFRTSVTQCWKCCEAPAGRG